MDIDFNHIRRLDGALLLVFRELMQTRQTTAAARRLGLSQSAVSHALRRLRDVTGDPLFRRRADGLDPTQRAVDLLPVVEEILRLSQGLAGAGAAFDAAGSTRHFRIGAADLVSTLLAAPLTRHLAAQAPQARLSFRFLVGPPALEALAGGAIDVAIGRFYGVPRGFQAETLWQEDFVVIARQGHSRLGALDLATYLALDHLLVSFSGRLTGAVDEALAARGLRRRVVASLPLFLGVFDAVAHSDAIATVSRRLATRHAAAFGLQVAPVPVAVPPFPVMAVRREGLAADLGYDWLRAAIAAAVAD